MSSTKSDNYGSFHTRANLSQTLYSIIIQHYLASHKSENQAPAPQLPNFMAEALHMICIKIAQIANGNPNYVGSWHGISEYAELAAQVLEEYEAMVAQKAAEEAASAVKPVAEDTVLDAEIVG